MGLFRRKVKPPVFGRKQPITQAQIEKKVDTYLTDFRASMKTFKGNREAKTFIKTRLAELTDRYDRAGTVEDKKALLKIIKALQQYASSSEPLSYL